MVNLIWSAIAGSVGILTFIIPAVIAPALPPSWQKTIADKYGWMSFTAFGEPRLRRKRLGSYTITIAEYDAEKLADKVDVGEEGHVRDYDDVLGRMYNKTFGCIYDSTTMLLDAELAELGHWHHRGREDAVHEVNGETRVNPFFEVPKEWHISDVRDAMYLISGDADPDDANTAEDFTDMALSEYRSRIGTTEMLATVTGFLASFGAVIFAQEYVLKGSSAGGGTPTAPPVPLGQLVVDVGVLLL